MKIVIVGMGKSGLGAKRLCEHFGYDFECVDADRAKGLPERIMIPGATLYVISPGIPNDHPQIRHAREKNIQWIGEAEFALRHASQKIIGITGTNGKTTMVTLLAHLIPNSVACGNIGYTLSEAVIESDKDALLIAELSSYQLETMSTPVFDAAAILNLSPDHLDRYPSLEEYAHAKFRIRNLLKEGAPFYVGAALYSEWQSELLGARPVKQLEINVPTVSQQALSFAQKLTGLSVEALQTRLLTFKKPPHRIEFVKKLDGISFYDDSKGTNVAAVEYALTQFSERVVLIAGGRGKKESFRPLIGIARKKVRAIVAIGESKEQIHEELSDVVPVEMVLTLEEAVQKAYATAERNEVVLLSPGCASLDMFANYIERGETFKRCVRELSPTPPVEKALPVNEQYTLF